MFIMYCLRSLQFNLFKFVYLAGTITERISSDMSDELPVEVFFF